MSLNTKIKEFLRKLHHNKYMRGIIYAVWIVGVPILGFYSYFIESQKPRHNRVTIKLPKKIHPDWESLKIVQISDLHFGPTNNNPAFFRKCVKEINSLNADLVVLTGDFMQWDSSFASELATILSQLKSKRGSYAILGNHDYGVCHPGLPATDPVNHEEIIMAFNQNGIRVLHNESISIDHGTTNQFQFELVGLGDFWTEHFKPHEAFNPINAKRTHPIILLSHNPDSLFQLDEYDFDLMLSGHVHGGQISWPLIGPLVVPVKNRHLRRGLHRIGDKMLYANRGLGYIFRARLLSPPEITEIVLS